MARLLMAGGAVRCGLWSSRIPPRCCGANTLSHGCENQSNCATRTHRPCTLNTLSLSPSASVFVSGSV
eukprot:2721499-Rhodomonas_salina.1